MYRVVILVTSTNFDLAKPNTDSLKVILAIPCWDVAAWHVMWVLLISNEDPKEGNLMVPSGMIIGKHLRDD
jgi:hypothetical protein